MTSERDDLARVTERMSDAVEAASKVDDGVDVRYVLFVVLGARTQLEKADVCIAGNMPLQVAAPMIVLAMREQLSRMATEKGAN